MPDNSSPCPLAPPLVPSLLLWLTCSPLLMLSGKPFQHSGRRREPERERFRYSKRGKKRSTRKKEKVPAEALQRSSSLQVQLLKLFQMCVQRFTSSVDRSEPRSGTITGFTTFYFHSFFIFFPVCVSYSSPHSLHSSHCFRCSGYQRQECSHTHTHMHSTTQSLV